MFTLIRFELKKITRNKFLWGLVIAILFINGFKIHSLAESENKELEGHDTIYNSVKGQITNEKINFVISEYNRLKKIIDEGNYSTEKQESGTYTGYYFGDYNEFEEIYNQMKSLDSYKSEMAQLCTNAMDNVALYETLGNTYEVRKNTYIISYYQNREITAYYDMSGTTKFLEYDFSSLLLVLLVITATAGSLILENRSKMFYLLESSERGIKSIIISKILAIAVFIFEITIVMEVSDLIFFNLFYCMEGLFQPLYYISEYKYTWMTINVAQYIMLSTILKFVCCLFFGMLVLLLSYFFMDYIKCISVSLLAFCGFVLMCLNTKSYVNPIALLVNFNLFKSYEVVNVFGYPIVYGEILVISLLCITFLMAAVVTFGSVRFSMTLRATKSSKIVLKRGGIHQNVNAGN